MFKQLTEHINLIHHFTLDAFCFLSYIIWMAKAFSFGISKFELCWVPKRNGNGNTKIYSFISIVDVYVVGVVVIVILPQKKSEKLLLLKMNTYAYPYNIHSMCVKWEIIVWLFQLSQNNNILNTHPFMVFHSIPFNIKIISVPVTIISFEFFIIFSKDSFRSFVRKA